MSSRLQECHLESDGDAHAAQVLSFSPRGLNMPAWCLTPAALAWGSHSRSLPGAPIRLISHLFLLSPTKMTFKENLQTPGFSVSAN